MLEFQPFSKNADPDVQYLVKLMRNADMTIANNENMIVDIDQYDFSLEGATHPVGGSNFADKAVADDWANMGIRMVTKANNHTFDGGELRLWENLRQLERVGIVHVGVGKTLAEARMARYAQTPKGLVSLVGAYAIPSNRTVGYGTGGGVQYVTPEQIVQLKAIRDSIVARRGEVADPIEIPEPDPAGAVSVFGILFKSEGVPPPSIHDEAAEAQPHATNMKATNNSLRLTAYNGVTAAQMAQLRAIAGDKGGGETMTAWKQNFRITAKPGDYTYDMFPQDEADILKELRTGKQFSSFAVATIHWHQNRFAFQHYSFDHYPADFEVKFAHDAIDQGADAFVGHGVHTIKGIEIYKGKPIFYGVSNYVFQSQMVPAERGGSATGYSSSAFSASMPGPKEIVGQGQLNELSQGWLQRPANLEALLTSSRYDGGRLVEVRIYPVDLGQGPRPGSDLGTPRRPSPAVARKILDEVIAYSKPFGTTISIEDGVGVIRLSGADKPGSH
ncbi:hypothetical protein AC629_06935 [Bradyrhizobium sp. NAS80.1]|nr:hypothetical protein AC629_06935 [Bradyrhizobium sp. NAS80.1]